MSKSIKILASVCSAGVLLGCASAEKAGETKIVPLMKVKHSTESADAYYALGRYLHGSRRYDEARNAYEHALQLDPRHARAGNALAVLYAETGDLQRATEFMQKLTAENPDTAYLVGNLGYVLFLGGQYQAAQTELEKAVALDPQDGRAWHNLGSVMEKLGQPERARGMFSYARTAAIKDRAAADRPVLQNASPSMDGRREMSRVEIAQPAPGIYEVRIIGAMQEAPSLKSKETHSDALLDRVEISNGNGMNGMAKAMSRIVADGGLHVVRLTNQKHFQVRQSRIEYKNGHEDAARALATMLARPIRFVRRSGSLASVDIRLVLGRDMRDAKAARDRHPDRIRITEK